MHFCSSTRRCISVLFTSHHTRKEDFRKLLFFLLFFPIVLHTLALKLLELLLGASSLRDFEDVEPDSLAEGPALPHGDNVSNLHIPATKQQQRLSLQLFALQQGCVQCMTSETLLCNPSRSDLA